MKNVMENSKLHNEVVAVPLEATGRVLVSKLLKNISGS